LAVLLLAAGELGPFDDVALHEQEEEDEGEDADGKGSRDNGKWSAVRQDVEIEVAIHSEDARGVQGFAHHNQGGVGQVHGRVGVFVHEQAHPNIVTLGQ
jgi:hypothetical protein